MSIMKTLSWFVRIAFLASANFILSEGNPIAELKFDALQAGSIANSLEAGVSFRETRDSFGDEAKAIGKPSIPVKRNAWDDCFGAPSSDAAGTILIIGDIVEGFLGMAGVPFPPLMHIFRLIQNLHGENDQCDGKSLWMYIDSHVASTVRDAFTNRFSLSSQKIAEDREDKMVKFNARLEWLDKTGYPTEQLKELIDDIQDYLQVIDPEDRYNFAYYESVYNFDYGLAVWYFADLVHKQTVLQMIVGLCKQLNAEDGDPKYRTSTYANDLSEYRREWVEFATSEGPRAMKELFWKSYTCDEAKRSYINAIARNQYGGCQTFSREYSYYECNDVFGKAWPQYYQRGYTYAVRVGTCGSSLVKFNAPAESTDPKTIQKQVTDWMYENFTKKIMEILGEETVSSSDDLPSAIFPPGCQSPCEQYGETSDWCITGINGYVGGSKTKCDPDIPEGKLDLPNPTDWGTWGQRQDCPSGSYARKARVRVEADKGTFRDDTGLTSIELECQTKSGQKTKTISSTQYEYGQWLPMYSCNDGFISQARLRSEKEHAPRDDVAVTNMGFKCSNGKELGPWSLSPITEWGDWFGWVGCGQNQAVCGIQTRVLEKQRLVKDDSALNDVIFYCCDL